MHFLHVVGARPNFMKVEPVFRALRRSGRVRQTLVHTGQHYGAQMSDVFFRQLGLPEPDINLFVGSDTGARQTARIMMELEPVLTERAPDLVLVYGDVNSTVAAAMVCASLQIRIAHIEAGLRSFDRTMPEEINRLITDQLADLLFTPSLDGNANLAREGISAAKVHFVGNVMIDTLIRMLPAAMQVTLNVPSRYALVTLHRPANVDDVAWLEQMLTALTDISRDLPILFPVHPRTRKRIQQSRLPSALGGQLRLLDPLPYVEFLALQLRAAAVVTDSGGIQEETSFLGVPCLTVRENTERPVTVTHGTNVLVGRDIQQVRSELQHVLSGRLKTSSIPPLWDGKAAQRIAAVLLEVTDSQCLPTASLPNPQHAIDTESVHAIQSGR
jgi:UDP-N-acetylglucosamine 2-epimerase (non-hydrolysing)